MQYLQINGTKILTNHIVRITKRASGFLSDGRQEFHAIIVDSTGQNFTAFSGVGSQVDTYIKALEEALQMTEVGVNPELSIESAPLVQSAESSKNGTKAAESSAVTQSEVLTPVSKNSKSTKSTKSSKTAKDTN